MIFWLIDWLIDQQKRRILSIQQLARVSSLLAVHKLVEMETTTSGSLARVNPQETLGFLRWVRAMKICPGINILLTEEIPNNHLGM